MTSDRPSYPKGLVGSEANSYELILNYLTIWYLSSVDDEGKTNPAAIR